MARTSGDPDHRQAVAKRLDWVLEALGCPLQDVANGLGYRDSSTLSAARRGRSVLESSRLEQLARWCERRGHPLDLHWLLTGDGSPWRGTLHDGWLTPERVAALQVLARGLEGCSPPHRSPKAAPRRTSNRSGPTSK